MNLETERFYPASPEAVYTVLAYVVERVGRIKGRDPYARSITFSTGASGWSWGATVSAHVVPSSGGALVRMGGQAKVGSNVTAHSAEYKNMLKVLDGVGAELRANYTPVDTSPPAAGSTTAGPAVPASSVADELAKLAALRDSGVLTEDEFGQMKRRLING